MHEEKPNPYRLIVIGKMQKNLYTRPCDLEKVYLMQGRSVVLDTETTGLSPQSGHRIVEIGAIALNSGVATAETFHAYINPERSMPEEAFRVHGLSEEFLQTFPPFADRVKALQDFLQDSPLIIHNAPFDTRFLNFELKKAGHKPLTQSVVDTLPWSRRLFPGAPANLDALCRRFRIDNQCRDKHGALIDAQLLAKVYGCLLNWDATKGFAFQDKDAAVSVSAQKVRQARKFPLTEVEESAHKELCASLPRAKWNLYVDKV